MTDPSHLTEEERQTLADGTIAAERARELDAHLRACDACAADVARLKRVMTRYSDAPAPNAPLDELWPSIRSRIDQSKVVPLGAPARKRSFTARHFGIVGGLVAAAVIAAIVLRPSRTIPPDSVGRDSAAAVTTVADSATAYEDEARALLNRFEVQRAMIRPEAAQSIDRDLKVIDEAIDELKLAIANDPKNPALRQLLASSYRQKVEILKRAGNAS